MANGPTAGDEMFPEGDPLVASVADLVQRYGYDAVRIELGYHQPLSVVASAPARVTDPETSHEAGPRSADLSRFSAHSRQAKLLMVIASQNLTDQQAALRVMGSSATPSRLEGCRRRMSDLRAAGYISDTGLRRHNVGSDDESIVWRLTLAGEKALANLANTGWSR
jgi:hypothetical protein